MIWACLLIPLLAVLFLAYNFRARMAWWEYLVLFAVPLVAILISYKVSVGVQMKDTEYWNSHLTKATYYESWETWKQETCYEEECSGSGEDRTCWQEPYDCSYCDRNSERWVAQDNIGQTYSITRAHYEKLCRMWGNRTFKDMRRSIRRNGLCGRDGDAYVTKFPGDFDLLQPVCVQHKYENRIQCSKSVFNFEPVDSADSVLYGLYRYPNYEAMGIFNYNPIVGWGDKVAIERLRKWNSKLGTMKQVHMMILVYVGKPIEAALAQERLWGKGNKNEFILCIGLETSKKTDWAYVISWTDEEVLKHSLAQTVTDMPFDLTAIVDTMAAQVRMRYRRKEFADFSYIKVVPSSRAVMITFLITLVVTIGLGVFAVLNPFEEDDPTGKGYTYRFNRRYRR